MDRLLASDPAKNLRHSRTMNFSAPLSTQNRKRSRTLSSEMLVSLNCPSLHQETSLCCDVPQQSRRLIRHRSCPTISDNNAVLEAESKVKVATHIVQEALQIAKEANALASRTICESAKDNGDKDYTLKTMEQIRSANIIAALAQSESLKSRTFLKESLDALSRAHWDNCTALSKQITEEQLPAVDVHGTFQGGASPCLSSLDNANSSPLSCIASIPDMSCSDPVLVSSPGAPDAEQPPAQYDHEAHDGWLLNYDDHGSSSINNTFSERSIDELFSLLLGEVSSDISDEDALDYCGEAGASSTRHL